MPSKERENQWMDIVPNVKVRFNNAIKSVYLIAFFIMLITVGALGIWIPPYRFDEIVLFNSESLFTYAGPILAMLLVEFFIQAEKSKLAVIALIVGIIGWGLITYGYIEQPTKASWSTILGTVITLILIFLVQANDNKYDDDIGSDEISSLTGPRSTNTDNIKDK